MQCRCTNCHTDWCQWKVPEPIRPQNLSICPLPEFPPGGGVVLGKSDYMTVSDQI
ncbi:hypothetical protein BaRGS_00025028, partial [Batillaria attramentaria]